MSTLLRKSTRLRKAISVVTSITTIAVLSGVLLVPLHSAGAVKPADFGLTEGDFIRATGDIDVYIVNDFGFKRLVLSPDICKQYGHLGARGCFDAVQEVTAATRDAFTTSWFYSNGETNDGKVYALVTTGEDTADLHHMNITGADFVSQGGDFQSVFLFNNLEQNTYSTGSTLTAISQIPPQYVKDAPSGPVSVALAPGNPAAATITKNANGLEMIRVRFTGTGEVSQITFSRKGAGATDDFDNVYVYDGANRLSSGKTFSSSTGDVTFANLKATLSGSKDLSLLADFSGTGGNVNYIEIEADTSIVMLDGTNPSGSFPLSGNNFALSGSNGGTYDIDKSGSLSNPNVGQKNVLMSQFDVNVNTEGAWVQRLRLINGGTVKQADISNARLEEAGVKVADGVLTSDGYVFFEFGTGLFIQKGDKKTFKFFGDVTGKKDETLDWYFENTVDVLAMGDQFGYNLAPSTTSCGTGGICDLDSAADATTQTLQGGVVTLAFNGPNATNVSTDTQDTVLLEFSITAATGVELRKHELVFCISPTGGGYSDAGTDFADIDDIKIVNVDTGVVLVGPTDGSGFTAADTDSCPSSAAGRKKQFTDVFEVQGGQTLNLKVTGDIQTSNTANGASQLDDTDVFRVILNGYGDLAGTSGDITVAKYIGTNTAITLSDFVPSGDMNGNDMTVNTSALTLGLAASPVSTTNVKGTKDIDAAGFTFAAGLASALMVTDLTLSGYVADAGSTLELGVGTGADSSMSVGALVSSVELWDGDTGTLISGTPTSNNLSNSTGTIVFNNLTWDIPAGQTKRLLVKTDLSTNNTSDSSDVFSFDIAATTDVTSLDDNSKTVNPGTAAPNGGVTPTVINTVSSAGSMTLSLAPQSPTSQALYWGQTGVEMSRFRLQAADEGFFMERFILDTKDTVGSLTNNIAQVMLEYTNKAGSTLTQVGSFNSAGSVSFGFSGTNRPYVPADSSTDLKVKVDLKTKTQGATNNVNFSIDLSDTFNGSNANGFRAVGEGSGTVLAGDATNIDDVAANNLYVYRVFPKVDIVTITTGEPLGTKDVLKFTVTAMGLSDSKLFFDGSAGSTGVHTAVNNSSGSIIFEVVASGNADSNLTMTLYDVGDGSIVDTVTVATAQALSPNASLAFVFATKDIEIDGGQSKTFRVETSFVNFNDKSDFFQLILRDDEAGLLNWVFDSTGLATNGDVGSTTSVLRNLPMNGPTFSKL